MWRTGNLERAAVRAPYYVINKSGLPGLKKDLAPDLEKFIVSSNIR